MAKAPRDVGSTSTAKTAKAPAGPAKAGATPRPDARGTTGPAKAPAPAATERGPRRARLQLRHINAWTVLRFSSVLAIALFFVWLIMVGALYGFLDAAGVIGHINDAVVKINGPGSTGAVSAGLVLSAAAITGAINAVLFIALSTVGSLVYNLCADLVGGVEFVLSER